MELKKPFFVIALILGVLIVVVELVGPSIIPKPDVGISQICSGLDDDMREECLDEDNRSDILEQANSDKPPGYGIRYLAMIDGPLLFTLILLGLSLILKERKSAKVQGPSSCVGSCLFILGGLVALFMVFMQLLFMLSLLFSPIFGTIAYFAGFGFFPSSTTAILLSMLMLLKIAFCIFLVLAHIRFLQNKGLVFLIICSLVANVIVSLLHGVVPSFLISITDAISAIILAIIGLIWGLIFFLKSIIPSLKALNLKK